MPTGPLKVSYIAAVMFQSLELPGKSINMEKMTISKLSIKSSCLWALGPNVTPLTPMPSPI